MYLSLVQDARFFHFLLQCDRDLVERARVRRCRHCSGTLHRADYGRKHRGGPADLDPSFDIRFSFCCATEGCRKRLTPPSLRFLGRRVYLAVVVVLAAAMLQGPTPTRVGQLRKLLGVSPRTLSRWRSWWRTLFSSSPFWKAARGMFRTAIRTGRLPRALLDQFSGDPSARLLSCLTFLAPITTRSAAGFSMAMADPQKMPAVHDPPAE